jgi:hypothetical protein
MKTIHTEIGIGAPAEIVWEVISDLEGWSTWNPVIKISGQLEADATIAVELALGAKPVAFQPQISMLEEGREFRWKGSPMPALMLAAEHGFRVTPEDTGRCRFEQFEMFSGMMAGRFLAKEGKKVETGFQALNRMLKREAEKRTRDRA